jgi:tetratricopeptide (TPR) repeat protein
VAGTAASSPDGSAPADSGTASDADPCLSDALCRAHFQRGRKLSKEDDYVGALAAYEAAFRRRQVPWLLLNVGRTQQKLGQPRSALIHFRRYLEIAPNDPPERLQKAKQYSQEAELEAQALPVEAQASLQGKPAQPAAATAPVPSPGPAPARQQSRLAQLPAWFWVGMAGGAAALIASAGTGATALLAAQSLQSPYAGPPDQSRLDLPNKVHTYALATDILIGVGVATLGATTIAAVVTRRKKEAARSVTPMVSATPIGASATLSGTF